MHVMSDCAATLGSRFNLIFDPAGKCVYHNAFGEFREQPLDLTAGIKRNNGELFCLPFTQDNRVFPYVEQSMSLTSLCYRGTHPDWRVEFEMKLRAPFYPRNARLSTAPVYYVDLTVRRLDEWRWSESDNPLEKGQVVFQLGGDDLNVTAGSDHFSYSFISTSSLQEDSSAGLDMPEHESFPVHSTIWGDGVEVDGAGTLTAPFDLSEDGSDTKSMLWTSWTEEAVLTVHGQKSPFKYHEFFASESKVASWAENARESVEERCDFLDGLFQDWTLGQTTSNFTALALHTFLANSWWTTRKGSDWFSVWEGACYYHSTVDVEYNNAMVYLALWPELLDMLITQWADFEVDAQQKFGKEWKGTSYICHDMGGNHVAGQQAYPHDMEVEESANYLLMLAARTFFTGNKKLAAKYLPLCRRLAEFIVKCDTTGTGFPDRGTANTIDDASPALQYGREQTYLAVKTQAALWALGELEDLLGGKEKSSAERWKASASKSIKTLNEKAWIKDHFAVTLSRTTEGLVDPWTGESLPEGELKGWDDCSIYTSNGMLYLFLANIKMPRWKRERFARDIETAERECGGPYGSRHTGQSDDTVWFSQNLWRDYVAAYLGIDMLNNVERYWEYQVLTGDNLDASLYYDTTPDNNLNFYPRGASVFGAPMAAAGMQLNRAEGELQLTPVRRTLRVPLLPLVDWANVRAQWLKVRTREGVSTARIENRDLTGDLTLQVRGAELEQA
ncbi:MAG: glutaminase domain-containing protein [Planctomycetota bacterium]